ncbi:MAG: helix-turn-helix domain-containing protein [Actinomycetota bacterium]
MKADRQSPPRDFRTEFDRTQGREGKALPLCLQPDAHHSKRDVRGLYIGISEAATCLDISRTTVWRYARDGKIRSVVMGTKRRPEHKLLLTDVHDLKRELDEQRSTRAANARKRRSREAEAYLRLAHRMLDSGEISLAALMQHPGSKHMLLL